MNRLVALVGALSLVGGTATDAQQRPDFSGVWVRVVSNAETGPTVAVVGDASFRRGDMGTGWGSPATIAQRADSLIVEYVFFAAYDLQPPIRFAFALDGSESRNSVMIGHETSVQRTRVAWRDSVLVITTLHPVPATVAARGESVQVRQTLTLESPTSLIVMTARHGLLGGPAVTTSAVYTKR